MEGIDTTCTRIRSRKKYRQGYCGTIPYNHIKKLQNKFEDYLKNLISYRRVKTPAVAKIVSQWRVDEAIDKLPLKKQMEIACDLIREKKAEDKLAEIVYIQKYLSDRVETDILLQNFNRLYNQQVS